MFDFLKKMVKQENNNTTYETRAKPQEEVKPKPKPKRLVKFERAFVCYEGLYLIDDTIYAHFMGTQLYHTNKDKLSFFIDVKDFNKADLGELMENSKERNGYVECVVNDIHYVHKDFDFKKLKLNVPPIKIEEVASAPSYLIDDWTPPDIVAKDIEDWKDKVGREIQLYFPMNLVLLGSHELEKKARDWQDRYKKGIRDKLESEYIHSGKYV